MFFFLGENHRDIPPRHFHEEQDGRRASSRGIIPRAKIKTVKMTFVIVFGEKYFVYILITITLAYYATREKDNIQCVS